MELDRDRITDDVLTPAGAIPENTSAPVHEIDETDELGRPSLGLEPGSDPTLRPTGPGWIVSAMIVAVGFGAIYGVNALGPRVSVTDHPRTAYSEARVAQDTFKIGWYPGSYSRAQRAEINGQTH